MQRRFCSVATAVQQNSAHGWLFSEFHWAGPPPAADDEGGSPLLPPAVSCGEGCHCCERRRSEQLAPHRVLLFFSGHRWWPNFGPDKALCKKARACL